MADPSSERDPPDAYPGPAAREAIIGGGGIGPSDPTLLDAQPPWASDPTRPADGPIQNPAIPLPLEPAHRQGSIGRIGHYEILNVVGRGGMGVVLRAFDEQLHRNVAIKLMSAQLISSDAARQRFVREARSAAGISHPNVVTIHAVAEQRGVPFLVMEYVDGRTLQDRITADAPLEVSDILRISAQISDGLAAAHRHGIVHRDVKPANVILEDGIERAKITDFGLARLVMEHSDLTSLQNLVGTPAYMSPEQVSGDTLDHRSDLFSLGCLMYAMVVGRSPFQGNSTIATARRVKEEPHRPLQEAAPKLPRFLSAIIDRLLEKDPAKRFQSADELSKVLTRHLADVNSMRTEDTTVSIERQTWPLASARGIGLVLASVAVVLLASTAIWFAINRGGEPPGGTDTGTVGETDVGTAGDAPSGSGKPVTPGDPGVPAVLTVASDGTADHRSLHDAIAAARAGDVIEVLDAAEYAGPFMITGGEQSAGLRIVSRAGATLTSATQGAVLTIAGTPGVVIEGFRISPGNETHSIYLHYDVTGCRLENLTLDQPETATWANMRLAHGCIASAEQPIIIRGCSFRSSKYGIYIGRDEAADEVEAKHVVVDGNDFSGAATHIAINAVVDDLQFRHNVFQGGTAFELQGRPVGPAGSVTLDNNTFFRAADLFALAGRSEAYEVTVRNNLFLETEHPPSAFGVDTWRIAQNGWEYESQLDGQTPPGVEIVADAGVPVREPGKDAFLRPASNGWAATAGVGESLPSYVGALAPNSSE